jgi:LytS/YehU family sensor histidine kinase
MDNDGEQEILAYSERTGELAVIRSDWKTYTSIPWNLTPDYCISILKTKDNPVICIHSSGKSGFITYAQNPHYIFRFLYYLAIYLFVLGFIYLVRWIQKKQLDKQNAVLKTLEELQLKLTKTRLDSHFTFNVLNSVIISIGQGRKDDAEKQLREFARMYRYLLSKAECVVVTLESELSFVDSYLLLENFRFDNRFEIVRDINYDTDLSVPIPKLIVQTLVENSIKHGLYNKDGDGKIILRVFQCNHHVQIDVEDNGIGRDAAQHLSPESSGLGFKMLYQILELYNKTSGIQIKCLVEDLKDEDETASGTRVSLMVPLP